MWLRVTECRVRTLVYTFFSHIVSEVIGWALGCAVSGIGVDEWSLGACSYAFSGYVITVVGVRTNLNADPYATGAITKIVERTVDKTASCERVSEVVDGASRHTKIRCVIREIRKGGGRTWTPDLALPVSRTAVVVTGAPGGTIGPGSIHIEGANRTSCHAPRTIIIGVCRTRAIYVIASLPWTQNWFDAVTAPR